MAYWKEMLLVYFIAFHRITAEGKRKEESAKKLYCFQCQSKISWDDCDKSSVQVDCPNDHFCLKLTAHMWELTTNRTKTGRVSPLYARYCSLPEGCSTEQCEEISWNCQIVCCNQHMCNASNSIWLTKILFVAVQGLAILKMLTIY